MAEDPDRPKLPFSRSPLAFLEDWYASQCDSDWEHSFGIHLETQGASASSAPAGKRPMSSTTTSSKRTIRSTTLPVEASIRERAIVAVSGPSDGPGLAYVARGGGSADRSVARKMADSH